MSIVTVIAGAVKGIMGGKGIGDLISEFIPDKDKAAEFVHKFEMATLADKDLERRAEVDFEETMTERIEAELHQNDLYTKRTRPKIARQSWYLTIGYAIFSTIGAPLLAHFTAQAGPDGVVVAGVFSDITFQWEVFIAIASPALTYMGVRTFDKWKNGGS
jgi:hypothetical protein